MSRLPERRGRSGRGGGGGGCDDRSVSPVADILGNRVKRTEAAACLFSFLATSSTANSVGAGVVVAPSAGAFDCGGGGGGGDGIAWPGSGGGDAIEAEVDSTAPGRRYVWGGGRGGRKRSFLNRFLPPNRNTKLAVTNHRCTFEASLVPYHREKTASLIDGEAEPTQPGLTTVSQAQQRPRKASNISPCQTEAGQGKTKYGKPR